MLTKETYFLYRKELQQNLARLVQLEQQFMDFLVATVVEAAPALYADFSRSRDLVPAWISYAPKQRGRAPVGDSYPWSEVGEKSLASNLLRAIVLRRAEVTFPGLPFGADVRCATPEAMLHIDIKMTGPRDSVDEIVAPPQQISGDGITWDQGILNSSFWVQGQRSGFNFQPKLPPLYVLDNHSLPCLTFFLKAIYSLRGLGEQPLEYMEIACVPNGLLMFDGPFYAHTEGLLIPGKDDQSVRDSDKRTRLRLNPLAAIDDGWRCRQIRPRDAACTMWDSQPRSLNS